ncbi:arginine deiminase-related protein [soil metagenome]
MPPMSRDVPALYSCSHVLMVEPNHFRCNEETVGTNAFQKASSETTGSALALQQHRALQELLLSNGVAVTLCRADAASPDAPFCNNWFSTHPAMEGIRDGHGMMEEDTPPTVVLYPLLAPNRRRERRADLVQGLFRRLYPRVINMSHHENRGLFLESTGSLCMHDATRTVYAALSPRTNRELADAWADKMSYRMVAFRATDAHGMEYYHTNVMMFIGHGVAGVCLESVEDPAERAALETSLNASGITIVPISRAQVEGFAGNVLSLTNNRGERLLVMSSKAWTSFTPHQQAVLEDHCHVLHTDLSVFEDLGGGSARCLIGELF